MYGFHLAPLIEGLGTGAALIIAIGPQNAFVLKQGILKNYVLVTALLCFLIDALLIGVGIGGFNTLLTSNTYLLMVSKWGGALFLFYYGFRSFKAALVTESLEVDLNHGKDSLKQCVLTLLCLSFLNPHVYLDTVVLIGSIGTQFQNFERLLFGIGAEVASCLWFFTLGYAARFLAPLFHKPIAWKVLDFLIGCIMCGIGLSLVL